MLHAKPLNFAVLGAGSWGTVLATLLARKEHHVRLWCRRPEQAEVINQQRQNPTYTGQLGLPSGIQATTQLDEAVKDTSAVIIAIPSQQLRSVLAGLPQVGTILSATKGLEHGSFKRITEIILEYQSQAHLAVLSGPNLAQEIAADKPATATIACQNSEVATSAQSWLNQSTFRVYRSSDVIGVELAGALKNVIALAAGMSDGLHLGDNAKASLITRGLAEILRLGKHQGAQAETFYGLAGLGDMIATCSSTQSRNHTAGVLFAQGASLADIQNKQLTAEGIPTVRAVHLYATQTQLDLPIATEVYRVVYEGKNPQAALRDLMSRDLKAEHSGQGTSSDTQQSQ